MRKRHLAFVLGGLAAIMAIMAPAATAATEFGDTCAGDELAPEYTLTTLSAPAGSLPLSAPSAGVITKLKVNLDLPGLPFLIPTSVKTLRPAGGNQYTVTGQATVNAGLGVTTADARLPVQAGDKLGLHGQPFSFEGSPVPGLTAYCSEAQGILGAVAGDVGQGSTMEFPEVTEARVPLAAVIEPDADGDGYGDETQDKCPQSAATQSECPAVVLDAFAVPKKNAVIVVVGASIPGPVSVSASAKLPELAGKASVSAVAKLKKVTHNVIPGKLRYFALKYSSSLKRALVDLPKGKKLKLKITASATNVAGQVSKDKTTLSLKGS